MCGPYALTSPYYDICREKDVHKELPQKTTFKECSLNETCARTCVKLYVEADDSSCGRKEIHNRKCVDYGIIHAQRHGACSSQKSADVINHAATMQRTCQGLDGLAWLDTQSTTQPAAGL